MGIKKKLKAIALIGISLGLVAALAKKCADISNSPEYLQRIEKQRVESVQRDFGRISSRLTLAEKALSKGDHESALRYVNDAGAYAIRFPDIFSYISPVDSANFSQQYEELRARILQLESQIEKEMKEKGKK